MKKVFVIVFLLVLFACESERIPYHCSVPYDRDAQFTDDEVLDADVWTKDSLYFMDLSTKDGYELGDTDEDAGVKDVLVQDVRGTDVVSGKVCSNIGVSSECGIEESCYPFIECGGICRKCGTLTAGSNCEIHSDCKCQMACLSLSDRQLKCYKVCNDNSDCPAGQICTDGWSSLYEHEYFKICIGTTQNNTNNSQGEGK